MVKKKKKELVPNIDTDVGDRHCRNLLLRAGNVIKIKYYIKIQLITYLKRDSH